jgi:SNF2 family DNA or RNA helicase
VANAVELEIDGEDVVVRSEALVNDRQARLFFFGSLGASQVGDGWRCPRRRGSIRDLAVRINAFLESKGWRVVRARLVDEAVEGALQRKRSFARTREAAEAFLVGERAVDPSEIRKTLVEFGWRSDQRPLRPHQEQSVVHGLTASSAANFSVPGAGKTASTLAIAAVHLAHGTIDLVLVIGPLSCFAPWEKETVATLGSRLSAKRIRGSADQRRAGYAGARRGDLLLVSYAAAASDKVALIALCRSHRVMLVADESHRIKRFKGGTWAPAIIDIAKTARVRIILSGTPMPQNGRDLYTQLNVLWPDGELTGPRDDFAVRVDTQFPLLLRDVRPFMSRTPKAALGLEPYVIQRHEVPLGGIQAEIYELIESQFRKRVAGLATWAEKIASLRQARPIRLLQAASNPDVLNRRDSYYGLPKLTSSAPSLMDRLARYRDLEIPAKTRFALQLVSRFAREGRKVVCWSNFIANLDQFAEGVRAAGIGCLQVDGRVAAGTDPAFGSTGEEEPETRERVIERFLDLPSAAVLVANPASCSESISLHSACHVALYLDRTFDCALFLQSIDRIHRLGLPEAVRVEVHVLTATLAGRATIDHIVDAALIRKEATMLQLLQGAELASVGMPDDPLEAAEGDEHDLAAVIRYLLGEQP